MDDKVLVILTEQETAALWHLVRENTAKVRELAIRVGIDAQQYEFWEALHDKLQGYHHRSPEVPGKRLRLISLLEARAVLGVQRYGTALRSSNGRDARIDAAQEALDLMTYLHQVQMESAGRFDEDVTASLTAALRNADAAISDAWWPHIVAIGRIVQALISDVGNSALSDQPAPKGGKPRLSLATLQRLAREPSTFGEVLDRLSAACDLAWRPTVGSPPDPAMLANVIVRILETAAAFDWDIEALVVKQLATQGAGA